MAGIEIAIGMDKKKTKQPIMEKDTMNVQLKSRGIPRKQTGKKQKEPKPAIPGSANWQTTDEDEINRRRQRAVDEQFVIKNTTPGEQVFANFHVGSASGMTYSVELRSLSEKHYACTCTDFRVNGLRSCKHLEAVLLHLQARFPRLYKKALKNGSERIDIVPHFSRDTLFVERGHHRLSKKTKKMFDDDGFLSGSLSPEEAYDRLCLDDTGSIRMSQEIAPWIENRRRTAELVVLRRDYEQKVHSGEYPMHETRMPLYPYQRQGMLHLAFTERALLADEMGLGKTIQAIAACALLHRLGTVQRVLVVAPASLKTEWEEQIERFTHLGCQVVYGTRKRRMNHYLSPAFFTLVNYEQVRSDALDINSGLKPDAVILDEAQRIKNWSTGTAQAVKRLESRYAFVLTGTPIENRIDELYSIIDFLDPAVFGPLFRFNRNFYTLNERGRPVEYKNLHKLQQKIGPLMLRRRKADVETELPGRTDKNFFVALSQGQQSAYAEHETQVARLIGIGKNRPLNKQEQEKLMRELAMMRMICDTNYILDPSDTVCPKLKELEKILDEALEDKDVKVVIFSEWVRMLELVKGLCEKMNIGYAWHTGSVPQHRRRAEIQLFKKDPDCRAFICSESGGVGLNLQNAGMVINCDLPWNPAKLEQRIARVWRKHQTRTVHVINLISENTIEHRMLETLSAKQDLADGVLDNRVDLNTISMRSGARVFFKRLSQMIEIQQRKSVESRSAAMPADRHAFWAQQAFELLKDQLITCEERYPLEGAHSVLIAVVERDAETWRPKLQQLHDKLFGPGASDPLAPVCFDVIDRATHEALKRLETNGLVRKTVRAARQLYPEDHKDKTALCPEKKARLDGISKQIDRKIKMIRLLISEDLGDETRPPLQEAVMLTGQYLATAHDMPVPDSAADALAAPVGRLWPVSTAWQTAFLRNESIDCLPVLEALDACANKTWRRSADRA